MKVNPGMVQHRNCRAVGCRHRGRNETMSLPQRGDKARSPKAERRKPVQSSSGTDFCSLTNMPQGDGTVVIRCGIHGDKAGLA